MWLQAKDAAAKHSTLHVSAPHPTKLVCVTSAKVKKPTLNTGLTEQCGNLGLVMGWGWRAAPSSLYIHSPQPLNARRPEPGCDLLAVRLTLKACPFHSLSYNFFFFFFDK